MMQDRELQALERKAFRSTVDDGLTDMRAALLLSVFAVAPLLSPMLGDFWSSAVWLPVYLAADAVIRAARRRWATPRLGRVQWRPERKAAIGRTMRILMAGNLVVLAAGLVFALRGSGGFRPSPWAVSAGTALFLLAVFTAAGVVLQLNRFLLYGLGTALAVLAGEWLFQEGLASHHGFPVAFGTSVVVLTGIGVLRFLHLLRRHPLRPEGEAHGDR